LRPFALILIGLSTILIAKIPTTLNSLFTQSTIVVKEQNWKEALIHRDAILKELPQKREALELKFLTLASLDKDSDAKTLIGPARNLSQEGIKILFKKITFPIPSLL